MPSPLKQYEEINNTCIEISLKMNKTIKKPQDSQRYGEEIGRLKIDAQITI